MNVKYFINHSFFSILDCCIACTLEVRPRQEALQCDRCDAWQHRTCDTGKYTLTLKMFWP